VKLIDYCNEHQIPYFYLNISYITTPDGKTKKELSSLPKGYMTMDYATAMKNANLLIRHILILFSETRLGRN